MLFRSLYDALEIGEEYLPHALPWSQVRSAYYRPWTESVKPAIPELQKNSALRITESPDFIKFLARRDRIHQRMKNPEISLRLSDRIGEITAEKELESLQEEEPAVADKDDPVLDETLNILADLADRTGKNPPVQITRSEP